MTRNSGDTVWNGHTGQLVVSESMTANAGHTVGDINTGQLIIKKSPLPNTGHIALIGKGDPGQSFFAESFIINGGHYKSVRAMTHR